MSDEPYPNNPSINFPDIFDNAPIGIFTSTPNGRYISVNPTLARMYGYDSPEELIESITDISTQVYADPKDRVPFIQLLEEQGEVSNHEARYRRKDGTIFWVSRNVRAVRDNNGLITHYHGFTTDITELKRAAEALHESERMYRGLSEDMPAMVCRFLPDLTLTYVNKTYCDYFGKTLEELIGISYLTLIPDAEHEAARAAIAALDSANPVITYDHQVYAPDGSIHWQRWIDRALFDDQGAIFSYQAVGEDITDRKKAEEEVRKFKTVSDQAVHGIAISDMQGNVLYINDYFARIHGYEPDELIGRNLAVFHNEQQLEDVRTINKALVDDGQYVNQEVWHTRKDGNAFPMLMSGVVIQDEQGAAQFLAATAIDITERKKAEDALRESEKQFSSLFMESPISIIVHDKDSGDVVDANPAAFTSYGLSSVDEMRKGIFFSGPPYSLEDALAWIRKASSEGPQVFEWQNRKITGEPFWELVNLKTLTISGVERVLASSIDITKIKQAEQEKEKLQSQLVQAQKMKSIGILSGGIAHEFNNLLQVISGQVQILHMNKPVDHPDATRLKKIGKTIDRASQLVRQLLLYSRRSEQKRQQVNLSHEVHDVARVLEHTIPRMIEIQLRLDDQLWPISADPAQMELILLNLANNAADAMPDGGKLIIETRNAVLDEVFARAHAGSSAGRHVLLSVFDTGCGMDKETLTHIFDPFFTTKEVGKGTGLGLPSVYGIVKAHGGHIQCYSEPGQGTIFNVYLPAVEHEDVCSHIEPQETSPYQRGSETVLMVDDEQDIRELTKEALESLGYTVITAATGEEALQIFKEEGKTVDLVLLDLNMPGMGGTRCLEELLQHDPRAKVVIASGYSTKGHGRNAFSSGAKGFISKPYRLQELAVMVRKALDE